MRVFFTICAFLGWSFFVQAEVQSAAEYTADCLSKRVHDCLSTSPLKVDQDPMDAEANCRKSYEPFCANETKTWCASYQGFATDGAPAGGGVLVQVPNGCSNSRIRPQAFTPTDRDNRIDINQARTDLKQCQAMQSTEQTCCGNPASCGGKNSSDCSGPQRARRLKHRQREWPLPDPER